MLKIWLGYLFGLIYISIIGSNYDLITLKIGEHFLIFFLTIPYIFLIVASIYYFFESLLRFDKMTFSDCLMKFSLGAILIIFNIAWAFLR